MLGLLLVPLLSMPAQAQKPAQTAAEIIAQLQKQVKTHTTVPTGAEYKALLTQLSPAQSLTLIKNLTPAQAVIAQIDKLNTAQRAALTPAKADTILNNLPATRAQNLVQNLVPTNTPPSIVDPTTVDPGKDLWPTVNDLIEKVRVWVIAIAVLIIIAAGIMYETSAMNPGLQGSAKTILWTTITGLIFMVLYPTIVGILSDNHLIPDTTVNPADGTTTSPPVSSGGST